MCKAGRAVHPPPWSLKAPCKAPMAWNVTRCPWERGAGVASRLTKNGAALEVTLLLASTAQPHVVLSETASCV